MTTKRLTIIGFIFAIAVLISVNSANAYRLPDTGQTKCYDNSGYEIACPSPGSQLYGQDAQYSGPQPAYHDNGNDTISDLNTGLMWQRSDTQNTGTRSWADANTYCNTATTGNHSDWRLPTVKELFSLVDFGRSNPAINTNYFPDCRASAYWSSEVYTFYGTDMAWSVDFTDGYVFDDPVSTTYSVRCVRTE